MTVDPRRRNAHPLMVVARPAPARNCRQHQLAGPTRVSGRAHALPWVTPPVIMSPKPIASRTEISLDVRARVHRQHQPTVTLPVVVVPMT